MNIVHDEGDEMELSYRGYEIVLFRGAVGWEGAVWTNEGQYVGEIDEQPSRKGAYAAAKAIISVYARHTGR